MSAVAADRRVGVPSVRDLRRWQRWVAALVLPIGPAAVAVLRFILPYNTTDGSSGVARKVLAHPGAQSVVLWLGFVAILTLVPAVFAVGRLTRRRAPRLTAAALLLAVPGYLSLTWLIGSDLLAWAGAKQGLDGATLGRLLALVHPTSAIASVLFVLGHVVGTVLLGIALWRTRVVPRWAALGTIVAQPLHFVAAVIVASHGLDLVAWGLNAVGFAAVAVAILRLPDEAWDVGPEGAGPPL